MIRVESYGKLLTHDLLSLVLVKKLCNKPLKHSEVAARRCSTK